MKGNTVWDQYLPVKQAFVLGLDDVIYPKRDFILQVYYLFAHFVEFTAHQPPAAELLAEMKTIVEQEGEAAVFDKIVKLHPDLLQFKDNFDRLMHQARLPLKLILNPDLLDFLQKARQQNKIIAILTAGDPLMQLNKIRQVEWQGLDEVLKVYFEDELNFRGFAPLRYLLEEFEAKTEEILYIGHSEPIFSEAKQLGIECLAYERHLK